MIATGRSPATIGSVATLIWRPSCASCSCAAGRCTSSEAISTFLRSRVFRRSAIFAAVVVLPEPCSPTSMIATGGVALRSSPSPLEGAALPPSISTR